jgi:hypothetical protein
MHVVLLSGMNELKKLENAEIHSLDPRWELVQRVAASTGFRRAARVRDFLLYVCERALEHHTDEITEQQIGTHVFGRPADYNSGDDNVVRAQARVLRTKLEQYFAGNEGHAEPIVITIPKGTYVPVFESRPAEAATLPSPAEIAIRPAVPGFSRAVVVLSILVVVLIGACVWLVAERTGLRTNRSNASTSFTALWDAVMPQDQQTLIVVSDHTYGLLQEAAGRPIPLSEYLSGDYEAQARQLSQARGLEAIVPGFSQLHLTGLYSVTDVALLVALRPQAAARSKVSSARFLHMQDFNSGNAILIGTNHTNPWVELFNRNLNFQFEWDFTDKDNYCVNRSPRAGEQPEYRASLSGSTRTVYGGIAFLPTLTRRGNALIVSGTSMAGNEISAGFITNEKLSRPFLDRLIAESGGKLPYFEVLLKTTSVGSQASQPEVVAYRTVAQ